MYHGPWNIRDVSGLNYVAGLNNKCRITVSFCASLSGELLPMQLIYQGKTTANQPRYAFPDDWDITFTPNHWSNETKQRNT